MDKMDQLEDDYDHPASLSATLSYCPTNVPGQGCDLDLFYTIPLGCDCSNLCSHPQSCSCQILDQPNYNDDGKYQHAFNQDIPIFECHESCGSGSGRTCSNRVVQKGPLKGLVIQAVPGKNLGLFTREHIEQGRFVCEYAGEVIGQVQAEARIRAQDHLGQDNYILKVVEHVEKEPVITLIDPTAIGNIGRYINHSCDPNLVMIPVRIGSMVPHVALFACRDIQAQEELNFHYGSRRDHPSNGEILEHRTRCLCRTKSCSGFLPSLK
ncbi:probable histone-lysine N-methyltransferase set-23 isoform X1 [Tigriopus californicus]|uniref:probable histone-lysine N-methyltransferase set-23 isoform X1 n=2 Tax=Tigriopus californicus TaxID=6832 RepID=UPI0027D9F674|nr:probable histone-lysine N-methyltransferase set-23 isoform X1 [Tigriopus californicus]